MRLNLEICNKGGSERATPAAARPVLGALAVSRTLVRPRRSAHGACICVLQICGMSHGAGDTTLYKVLLSFCNH